MKKKTFPGDCKGHMIGRDSCLACYNPVGSLHRPVRKRICHELCGVGRKGSTCMHFSGFAILGTEAIYSCYSYVCIAFCRWEWTKGLWVLVEEGPVSLSQCKS